MIQTVTQTPFLVEPPRSRWQATAYQIMALFILGVHAYLGAHFGLPGFAWFVVLTFIVFSTSKEMAFTLMLSCLFLQNAFIGLVADSIKDITSYKQLQATSLLSIIFTSLICLPIWMGMRLNLPQENRKLLFWLILFFAMTIVYSIVGMAHVSFGSVAVYARLYISGGLMLVIGIAFGLRMPIGYIVNGVRAMAIILILWGICEFFFTYQFYEVFHMADYLRLKFLETSSDFVFTSVADAINFSSRSFLNLSGSLGLDLEIIRMNGPNMHPISYAYALIFCGLVCFTYRSYWLTGLCLFLAILVGAKGPIIIAFVTLSLYGYYAHSRKPHRLLTVMLLFMAFYSVVGIAYGIYTRDFHVVGLMGGLKGFSHNPLGHGIGMGGTLSAVGAKSTLKDLEFYQVQGADYGFESSVGVVLYQVGIGIIIFFMFYKRIWQCVWRAAIAYPDEPHLMIIPIVLALLVVNGIFQEEALSPVGWGLWLMYGGLLLGRHWRKNPIEPLIFDGFVR